MAFRVGQKVRIVDGPTIINKSRVGMECAIDEVDRTDGSPAYRLVINDKGVWFSDKELQAVDSRPARRPPASQCACSDVGTCGNQTQGQDTLKTMATSKCGLIDKQKLESVQGNASDAAVRTATKMMVTAAANAIAAGVQNLGGPYGQQAAAFLRTDDGKAAAAAILGLLQLFVPQLQGCKMNVLGNEMRTQSIQCVTDKVGVQLQPLIDLFNAGASSLPD